MTKGNILKGLLVFGMVFVFIMIGNSESFAQKGYPNREIELVITFSAGGMADVTFRTINDDLAKNLGVPVVIVNKTGASGTIGAHYVSQSKPDGYTIGGTSNSTLIIAPLMIGKLAYKPSDLVPIARIVSTPQLFAVRKDAPWKTIDEFIAQAKKNPGKLTCSSVGVGSTVHFGLEMLKIEAGVDIQHIPFKGGGEQIAALIGGHTDLAAMSLNPTLPLLKSGDMRAIVTSGKIKEFPEVPTLAEKGWHRATFINWVACFGPKGIEKSVVDKLVNALEKVLKVPKVVKSLEDTGSQVDFEAKEKFAQTIEEDLKRLGEVIKKANLVEK
jgi:tripartite-type tricarboxylate transporter receptor subunit TctC